MNIFYNLPRPAAFALLALATAPAVHAVADPRTVVCAQACTLQLKAAKGFIDIKIDQSFSDGILQFHQKLLSI